VWVEGGDGCIVPLFDATEVDVGEHGASQFEAAGFDTGDIDHGDNAADDHRELHELRPCEIARAQWGIRGAEVHLALANAVDAGA